MLYIEYQEIPNSDPTEYTCDEGFISMKVCHKHIPELQKAVIDLLSTNSFKEDMKQKMIDNFIKNYSKKN